MCAVLYYNFVTDKLVTETCIVDLLQTDILQHTVAYEKHPFINRDDFGNRCNDTYHKAAKLRNHLASNRMLPQNLARTGLYRVGKGSNL